jgi:demethylmenaquinone methyltransferase/2-methoxy-6-polyprenyl-1,4-benzoquinol methylase
VTGDDGRPSDRPAVTADPRGARLYDRLAARPWLLGLVYAATFHGDERAVRRASLDALGLDPGDRVLELGCGPGNSLAALADRVGPAGRVVALDYSAGMVGRARDRPTVDVLRADATRPPVADGSFDAVYAAMSLSATADPAAAVEGARAALRPGGRLVVLDARPFRRAPWTALSPVVEPVARRLTNWHPETDVAGAMRDRFASVAADATTGGAVFVAVGRKEAP